MQPSVAVVIPILNEALVLPQTLTMLDKLSADEICFVDGGSTDQSRELVVTGGYPCLESSPGRAIQMNMGAKQSRSEIILFLHTDTKINSSHILDIKKTYNQGFDSGRFDISFDNDSIRYSVLSFFINFRSRVSKISTGDQAMFVRRDRFERLGGFKKLPLMEDIELASRLRNGGRVACLKNTVITSSRRWEQHGFFRTIVLMWKLRLFYWLGISPEKLAQAYRNVR